MSAICNHQGHHLFTRQARRTFVLGLALGLVGACTPGRSLHVAPAPRSIQISEATILMGGMQFTPHELHATVGEPLMVTLVNDDTVAHDFVMETPSRTAHLFIPSGRRIATSLYFDIPGRYRFVCSQSGHEQAGMTGTIVVEGRAE